MRIEKYPLTDSYYIIVFEGRTHTKYTRGTSNGYIIEDGSYVNNDFANARLNLEGYRMLGKILEKNDVLFEKVVKESGHNTNETPKTAIISFLKKQGYEVTENTWMLCPKPAKKLTGKKIPMVFDLGNPDFNYGEHEKRELDVYMTPITHETKSVKFFVMIPDHLYNACALDPNEDLRPKQRHIESEALSYLHAHISSLANQAFSLAERKGCKKS